MSTSTPIINADLARRLIASQFPQWSDLSIEQVIPSGCDNRTFRLGPKMLIRLPSASRYAPQVEKEQKWLPVLSQKLPIDIPVPIVAGEPEHGYPWRWSVYHWLEGSDASTAGNYDRNQLAETLAKFLRSLWEIETLNGPPAGPHNFYRGGRLETYDAEFRESLIRLRHRVDADLASDLWETALASKWEKPPVWVHGDIHPSNMLVRDGRLTSVIDFGCLGIGDPACDLTISWTFFDGETRNRFRELVALDQATWARSRGWAIWKGLNTLANGDRANPDEIARMTNCVDQVLEEHQTRQL